MAGKRLTPPAPLAELAKGKKPERLSVDDDLRQAIMTPPPDSRGFVQIMLTVPFAYYRVLDSEAQYLALRRYQFIHLLYLNEAGEPFITRPRYFPIYRFTKRELKETHRVLVQMLPEIKVRFDDHISRRGLTPSTWLAGALIRWAHLEAALDAVER